MRHVNNLETYGCSVCSANFEDTKKSFYLLFRLRFCIRMMRFISFAFPILYWMLWKRKTSGKKAIFCIIAQSNISAIRANRILRNYNTSTKFRMTCMCVQFCVNRICAEAVVAYWLIFSGMEYHYVVC